MYSRAIVNPDPVVSWRWSVSGTSASQSPSADSPTAPTRMSRSRFSRRPTSTLERQELERRPGHVREIDLDPHVRVRQFGSETLGELVGTLLREHTDGYVPPAA